MNVGSRTCRGLAALLAGSLAACTEPGPSNETGASTLTIASVLAPPSANVPQPSSAQPPPPPASPSLLSGTTALLDSNPLRLPPRRVTLDPGKRVFTFSDQMLQGAKPGSTLVLYAATVAGFEGDDLIIEGRAGPSYKVHAGYVIPVPDDPRIKPGDVVLTEWNSVMRHALVTRLVKDKIAVRFTDMDTKPGEVLLQGGRATAALGPTKVARFVRQAEGLQPGNYAALQQGSDVRHVLLVSPSVAPGERKRWFCLGFGGAAMIVDEADLRPIPVRYTPKVGATVWAEWAGTMRKATVQSAEDPGLFTVKYERAGRPATVGFGLIMPPLEEGAAAGRAAGKPAGDEAP